MQRIQDGLVVTGAAAVLYALAPGEVRTGWSW
jgi:hypothetical protein